MNVYLLHNKADHQYTQRKLFFFFFFFFFEGLYSQKIKTLKTTKSKTRKIKFLMEEEIPSGTN